MEVQVKEKKEIAGRRKSESRGQESADWAIDKKMHPFSGFFFFTSTHTLGISSLYRFDIRDILDILDILFGQWRLPLATPDDIPFRHPPPYLSLLDDL